jgi:hypothetical protein
VGQTHVSQCGRFTFPITDLSRQIVVLPVKLKRTSRFIQSKKHVAQISRCLCFEIPVPDLSSAGQKLG